MRALAKLSVSLFLAALLGCGDDSNSQAGIEVGNPSIELGARFVVDYSVPEFEFLKTAAKLPGADEPVLITDIGLGLAEVLHYSSFYVPFPSDPLKGLRIWPHVGQADTLLPMVFGPDGQSELILPGWHVNTQGILKEIGFVVRPLGDTATIRGQFRDGSQLVPFEFALTEWQALQLRYHAEQIEAGDGSVPASIPVRFHVPVWIAGVDFASAVPDKDGVVRIYPTGANALLWNKLDSNFFASFNCLRWSRTDMDSTVHEGYVPTAMDAFDQPGRNWVRDGKFAMADSEWIFIVQFGGTASIDYQADGVALIEITDGGTEVFSEQLLQENIPIIAGHKYRISFRAKSTSGSEIVVRIGLYHSPYSGLSPDFNFGLFDGWGSYSREFTATETNLFGRLEFNIGGYVRNISLTDIKVEQVD